MYIENKPIENPELLVAMELLAQDGKKENQIRVADCVISGRFLAPINLAAQPPEPGSETASAPKVGFMLLKNAQGSSYIPAFSDWAHLLAWNSTGIERAAILTFDEYANIISRDNSNLDGFVVNPGEGSVTFSRDNISFLKQAADLRAASAVKKQSLPEGAKIMLGDAAKYPDDLLNAISSCLRSEDGVQAAYMRAMKVDESEGWFLIIEPEGDPQEFYGGDPQELFSRIAVASRQATHGKPMNMMLSNVALAQEAIKNRTPFYKKETPTA